MPQNCPGGPWTALQVAPNHEQTVARHLDVRGIEMYLPLVEERRRWSDRVKSIYAPLFPGYVFCKLDSGARSMILSLSSVLRIVSVGGAPAPIAAEEITSIKALVRSNRAVRRCDYLKTGDMVRIESGPLAGAEGFLVRAKGEDKLVVSLHLLARSVAVELDDYMVSRITMPDRPPMPAAISA